MYIVRIYFNDEITDIDIKDFESFSIGSGAKDNHIISDTTIKNKHICFFKSKDIWKVKCNGETYVGNEIIKLKDLTINDTYILNKNKKIAISIIPIQQDSEKTVDISNIDEVIIGRNSNCDIIFNNKKVSGNHAKIYKLGTEFHLADINSTNGTFLNNKLIRDAVLNNDDIISIGIYKIIFKNGSLSFQNTGDDLTINLVSKRKAASKEYPYFMRSPRLKLEAPTGEIEIQAPPNLGSKPEINWLTVLLPPISMISIMIAVVFFTGGNPVSLMYTAPMSLISIMVSTLSYNSQKKKHIQKEHLRLERYNEHLQEAIKEIENKTSEQLKAVYLVHPDTNECINIVHNIERRLWERKPQDDDFMSLRIGAGTVDFNVQLRIPKQTVHLDDDDLLNKPHEIASKYKYIKDAPIVFNMLKFPSGGIVGKRKEGIHLVRNMIIQAATHHCYDELKIITIFPKSEMEDWDWIRWLPHSFNDNRSERYIACDTYGATAIFKQFDEVLAQRLREIEEEDDYRNNDFKIPYYLFIIADRTLMEEQTIMKYLICNNKKMGIGALFLYDDISLLSRDCAVVIDVKNSGGIIYNKENASDKKEFEIDKIKENVDTFSRALAPIRVSSMSEELMLPSCVTFLEGYGVKRPNDINIADNWVNSLTYKSMAVPIGVKANGDKFLFDIHEKYHGPHGLVAGMTGSGKSEMVQSWILSMALKFSPQDVSFVLIDFKGTGLILPFLNMPHLAGTISDLDTNINRNLIALENELSRRKALLDSVGVNNITGYLKL
ncbi:MAG: FtsK/SpoIIIE domain-containing protein, partial [Bacteroidales bacterium]